jgi:hypothetical protein
MSKHQAEKKVAAAEEALRRAAEEMLEAAKTRDRVRLERARRLVAWADRAMDEALTELANTEDE